MLDDLRRQELTAANRSSRSQTTALLTSRHRRSRSSSSCADGRSPRARRVHGDGDLSGHLLQVGDLRFVYTSSRRIGEIRLGQSGS
jgi:hypothetical protein